MAIAATESKSSFQLRNLSSYAAQLRGFWGVAVTLEFANPAGALLLADIGQPRDLPAGASSGQVSGT